MASLTRDEAITRAGLLEVTSMEVALDLTTGAEHFGSVTTIRFGCREPGSATFVELNPVSLAAIRLNGRDLDPGQLDDRRFPLTDLAADFPGLQSAQVETSSTGQAEPPARLAELSSEEQAILELVDKVGQVTPKLLQEKLRVSKATATRKLADLVEQGLLVQHGRGRGTHYKRPTGPQLPSTPAVAVDQAGSAQIVSTLRQHEAVLRARYALSALGLVVAEQLAGNGEQGLIEVAARFSDEPNLRTFFQLEHTLCDLAHTRIDVRPYDQTDNADPSPAIVWIWS